MIDLIIPCYNAEKTIDRCFSSILAQTKQRKFIITIVDDYSTDNTLKKLEKYKSIINFNILQPEKHIGKPGLVRQYGIDHTTCPYIMFMDSDDMLAATAAEVMSRAILQKQPDVIFGGFTLDNGTDEYEYYSPYKLTWVHGNAYKREYLNRSNIRFDDKFNEDGSFNIQCRHLTDNIFMINQPLYYWMNNKESLTRSNNKFMLEISEDYVKTYTDAFKHIIDLRPEKIKDSPFIGDTSQKLAEFFEFIDANSYYFGEPKGELINFVREYVELLKNNNMLTKKFLKSANIRFNNYKIFANIIRSSLFLDFLDYFEIDYQGVFSI